MLLEIALAIALCVVMARVANADGLPPLLWGIVTAVFCAACILLIPYAFLRILIAATLAYAAMMVSKMITR